MSHAPYLTSVAAPAADLVIRGARVLDPNTGIDGVHDVVVRDGEIAEITAPGAAVVPAGAETLDGTARHLFHGFFDPHVHRATSTRSTSRPARAPRPPAATAASSRCRTPTRCWTPRRC
jgi:imidazolonepropionase-like amidohydrolase